MATNFKTQLQVVPRPAEAPKDSDEVYVRLIFLDPEDASGGCAFTMTVSDMLALFYGMVADLKQIVHEDAMNTQGMIPLGPGVWGLDG